ncbi:MAG: Gfo/Idh/MocA family oxidoreductase [Planctomycetes bacterium]|nr:Gfo/Idh/MocA family oxidoreductase [Planctomycetota bacterium]
MDATTLAASPTEPWTPSPGRRLRLGFAGVGWIGRSRLQSVVESETATAAAIVDPSPDAVRSALELAPDARAVDSFDELIALDLDGVVIATPSAMHARQATAALERGLPVFCQKPLARTTSETIAIVEAARRHDRLLAVDLSYRHVAGVRELRRIVQSGELGTVYAADLTFHNAYGPDKPWFYDAELSGGGCVIDLGTHLVDFALWVLSFPSFAELRSRLYCRGELLDSLEGAVEDCALADCLLAGGTTLRLACSWKLPAGQDAAIEAVFYGTEAAVALRNVGGSFYDFTVERQVGTSRRQIASGSADSGSKAIVEWSRRLAESNRCR